MDRKKKFETILQTISSGKLSVKEMISEIIPLKDYLKIYKYWF